MATHRWHPKTHRTMNKSCRLWVETVILCSFRLTSIANGWRIADNPHRSDCWGALAALFWPSRDGASGKPVVLWGPPSDSTEELPAMPWEMWLAILSFVTTFDMRRGSLN
eukprot:m.2276 g.2276  ORF g.2276 m.2276 type:complete len:110 (-) comp1128_c0_seq3:402-731(-)